MYTHVKTLAAMTLPLLLSTLLSACGGAPADEPSNNQSSAINKPTQPSSMESSGSTQSSSIQATISSLTASSNKSLAASSLPKSSADSYSRVSRTSSSTGGASSQIATPGTDTIPPDTTKLLLQKISTTSITLKWDHATDNVGVWSYEIERNGSVITTLEFPTYAWSDINLTPYTDYNYTIRAFDLAGNPSVKSVPFGVRTLASPNSSIGNSSKSSKSSSSKSSSSSTNSNLKSSSSSTSSNSATPKTITINWNHSDKRENGRFLELDEIGGYELRFKTNTNSQYTYFTLHGNTTTTYSTDLIPNGSEIQIAVFDTNGLYSDFITIAPQN